MLPMVNQCRVDFHSCIDYCDAAVTDVAVGWISVQYT